MLRFLAGSAVVRVCTRILRTTHPSPSTVRLNERPLNVTYNKLSGWLSQVLNNDILHDVSEVGGGCRLDP